MTAMDEQAFRARLETLARNREHGAGALARAALAILVESAESAPAADGEALKSLLTARARTLRDARPSMAPLANLVSRWTALLDGVEAVELAALRREAARAARALEAASRQAVERAADNAAQLIGPGRTVITHSLSATVRAVFSRLKGEGLHVILTESRPLYEGHALAGTLAGWGVPASLITEAQMGLFTRDADVALVGADTVLPDGAAVNKAGTLLLALAACKAGIPFYVCFESFKRLPGEEFPPALEEMAAMELGAPGWPGVDIRNVYFDVTPPELISAWITEEGVAPAA